MILLHLLLEDAWVEVSGHPTYSPASLASEGFVHCTAGDELMLQVANSFYAEVPDEMVVLSLDADRLRAEIRWEPPSPAPPAGAAVTEMPHVYGPIDLAAVVGVRRLRRDVAGAFEGYEPYEPRA